MAAISTASVEQSSGIDQVNRAIVHIDNSTQQNATLVEEATAAAESLQDQARQLARSVGMFKLGDGVGDSPVDAMPEDAVARTARRGSSTTAR
jgi:hypothetical protein